MLCEKCHKNQAKGRYAEVVNGRVNELHLCPECLARQQSSPEGGFELSGPVSMSRPAASPRADAERSKGPRVCKTCGTRKANVLESGLTGCSVCYTTFAEDLAPILFALHGNTRHLGKTPHVDDSRARLRGDLHAKRAILRTAIQNENYEEAATLRDQIRQLETALQTAEGGSAWVIAGRDAGAPNAGAPNVGAPNAGAPSTGATDIGATESRGSGPWTQ